MREEYIVQGDECDGVKNFTSEDKRSVSWLASHAWILLIVLVVALTAVYLLS